jgi:hypothetical protein
MDAPVLYRVAQAGKQIARGMVEALALRGDKVARSR